MNANTLALLIASAALTTACGSLERSRDLNNPLVSATTLAQQVCSNCHGVEGNATSPNFPNLAGQREGYVVAQLNGFKSRGRHDPAGFEYMWGLSRRLSDGQVQGLAAYYAAQVPQRQPVEGRTERMASGRAIFEDGIAAKSVPACVNCHGRQGEGMAAFPRLAGQHADYVVKQLEVFQRSDDRPEGSVMKTVAHELSPQDIEDVAGWVQTLPLP